MDRCVYRRVLQDDGRGHRQVKVSRDCCVGSWG